MTFIPDLEPCTYFDRTSIPAPQREARWVSAVFSTSLTAVGWLGTEADFPTSPIPVSVRDKLEALTHDPWEPWMTMGCHYCGLCARKQLNELARELPPAPGSLTEDFIESWCNDSRMRLDDSSAEDSRNVFIPGDGFVYAVPALIRHYIDAHQYQPPAEFCDAVLACPPMGSSAYFEALVHNGSGDFRSFVECWLASFDDWAEDEKRQFESDQRPAS